MQMLNERGRLAGPGAGITAIILVLATVIAFAVTGTSAGATAPADIKPPETSASPSPTPTPEQCSETWVIEELPILESRRFFEGVAEIQAAVTPEEAADAAFVVLEKFKVDPDYLVVLIKMNLHEDVATTALVDSDGCASSAAGQYVLRVGAELAKAKIIVEDAPMTGTNSGVNADGTAVSAASAGVSGDRKAIKVVLEDGTTYWIMARCANIVTEGPPPLPPGPTDNPPPPRCEEPTPDGNWPYCKDSPTRDPAQNGNANTGGGRNADPGPGLYIPQAEMTQPPSVPYVAPAPPPATVPAPAPSTPGNPTPAPVPTPDPAPAPTPQPSAPPPTDPVGGCTPLPGSTTCTP